MKIKQKLPVSYLLFTTYGRINRITYWTAAAFIWTSFYLLFNLLEYTISYSATLAVYPLLFWAVTATSIKRLHDINTSGYWLWLILIPVLGPLILIFLLGFKKGNSTSNKYGEAPGSAPDYFINPDAQKSNDGFIVNDVTQINPVTVSQVFRPVSANELSGFISKTTGPLSTGGGRFSMGGQTASSETTHIDMRALNKVLEFSKEKKLIKVEAGIRWCDIQKFVDAEGLSVKIMQTYANFTVGGSLSVNVHGRYIGLGPLILSVRSLDILMADGSIKTVSRTQEPELFFACVGCYNAIAIIVAAELELEENVRVLRGQQKMPVENYLDFFRNQIRDNKNVVFHNGDLYPPKFKNVRAVSWEKTDKKATEELKLMPLSAAYPVERYFIGAFSRSNFGKWRREFIIDPLLYARKKVHWRNYEAGYDVAELEPSSRKLNTYVLQEYFIPVAALEDFVSRMRDIFTSHKVNVINVSIRHALPDDGSLLAWAKEEVFAFVIWYKQGTDHAAKLAVGNWTREMVDAVLLFNGSYYLPYQVHATEKQFHRAYPRAKDLFALKHKLDPDYRFRNVLWDTYYKTYLANNDANI